MNSLNGYKAVAYDKLSVLLVEGMKEQQRQIETYKAENENLKSKLETLQEKVDQIEAMIAKGGLK
jgi:cell division protein FtsB